MEAVDGLIPLSRVCRLLDLAYITGWVRVRSGQWPATRKGRNWYLTPVMVAELLARPGGPLGKPAPPESPEVVTAGS